ncbi:MAG: cell division protein FtsL [Deltaproteobacteria bacterium]|nr:cell division protein FtsL [Deltaproteobacteria bacterium]
MAVLVTKRIGRAAVLGSQDVKVRRDLTNMNFFYLSIFTFLMVVLVFFGYLWTRLAVVQLGYEISRADQTRNSLIETNRRIKAELTELKSPARIERIAMEELGLVYPADEQIIRTR